MLVLALPCVVLGLVYACNSEGCFQLSQLTPELPGFPADQPLYSHTAMAAVVGWFLLVLLLHVLLPGEQAQGVLLPSGRRLSYKLNGEPLHQLLLCWCVCVSVIFKAGTHTAVA